MVPTATATNATRTRLPRAERMEQTLAAAHALFAARGYRPVTMDEVAAAVGVTKPLLYNYFGNKERLYLACMEPAGDALVAAVVGAVERTSTPQEALRAGIHAFFAFVDQDRGSWRVLFDETLPAEGGVARRVGEYRTRIVELVAQALLAQPSVSSQLQVEALSVALLGAAEALVRWWLRSEALTASATAELLIATVEPGLAARVKIHGWPRDEGRGEGREPDRGAKEGARR
ncbi:MAG TPA: TetR/AcrR family transcriptional regulator [Solirubrobacteraceae bacterium]|nr:TetR/AcrR family transcriptional regulator [Solirubrobacteraceae bacterium]